VNSGSFDKVPVNKIKAAEDALLNELKTKHKALTEAINTGNKPTDEQNAQLTKVAETIAKSYAVTEKAKAEAK
jgi:F-type H+/Na+-transporting ATPase subunit alpha